MKVKRLLAVGLVMTGLLPLACGGGDEGGEPAEEQGPEFSEVPALLAQAYCEALSECVPPELVAEFLGTPSCDALLRKEIENGGFQAIEVALEAGGVVYHPGKVDACLDAVRNGGCVVNTPHPECDLALAGTVASGGDCTQDAECIGDRFCLVDGLCPGTCSPKLEDGNACERDDDCGEGSQCFEAVCTDQPGVDEECEEDGVECEGGNICLGASAASGVTGTCRPMNDVFTAAEGEACNIDNELCEPGSFCALSIDGAAVTWTCMAQAPSGGDCHVALPDMCPTGESCVGANPEGGVAEGTCTQLPTDGDDCLLGRCAAEHVCVQDVCRKVKPNGEDCSVDAECYSEKCDAGSCIPDTPCAL